MKRIQSSIVAFTLFCFAFSVRILYVTVVGQGYISRFDAKSYESIALHLFKGQCYCIADNIPTVGRAPAWPTVIAAIYALTGPQNLYARYFLCMLGAGTCVLVYLFCSDLFTRRVGILAGILAALYPGLFIYDGWLYSESLYTFLLFASIYVLLRLQRTTKARWAILCGVLLGLLSLTRPNGLVVIALAVVWLVLIGRMYRWSWRNTVGNIALIVVVTSIFIAPWTLRNYTVAHALVPVAVGDGTVLAGAYNNRVLPPGESQGQWVSALRANPDIARAFGVCSDAPCDTKRDAVLRQRAGQWVGENTTHIPFLLGMHLLKMWTPMTPEADLPMHQFPERGASRFVVTLINAVSIPLFLIAAFGLWATRRRWRDLLFVYFVVALTTVQCLYFYGSSRFRAPIEPLILVFVAGVGWWLRGKLPMKKTRIEI